MGRHVFAHMALLRPSEVDVRRWADCLQIKQRSNPKQTSTFFYYTFFRPLHFFASLFQSAQFINPGYDPVS
jgi:hypothetical protein